MQTAHARASQDASAGGLTLILRRPYTAVNVHDCFHLCATGSASVFLGDDQMS